MKKYVIRGWDNIDCRDRGMSDGHVFSFVMDAENENSVFAYCDYLMNEGDPYSDLEDITEEEALDKIREEYSGYDGADEDYKEFMERDHKSEIQSADIGMGYPIVFNVCRDNKIILNTGYDESDFVEEYEDESDWEEDYDDED